MTRTLITISRMGMPEGTAPMLTTTHVGEAMAYYAANEWARHECYTYATIDGAFSEALSDEIDLGIAVQPIESFATWYPYVSKATVHGLWSDAMVTDLPASERRDLERTRVAAIESARMGSLAPLTRHSH